MGKGVREYGGHIIIKLDGVKRWRHLFDDEP